MKIDEYKIVVFFLVVFAVHSIYLAVVSGVDGLNALHSSSLLLLITKLLLLSVIYRLAHVRVIRMFTAFIILIGGIYTFAYWIYYFAGDVKVAEMLWTLTSLGFTLLTAGVLKKMHEINPRVMKRVPYALAIAVVGSAAVLAFNGWDFERSIPTIISVVSFSLLYIAFSLSNIYMKLFALSYILMTITDAAFFNFYGKSLEINITIDMLYFFIYSLWVLLFGGLALELAKIREKEINIIKRWKHGDP